MKRLSLLLLLIPFLFAACDGSIAPPAVPSQPAAIAPEATTASPSADLPRLEERACDLFIPKDEIEGETIQCGYAVMPALRDHPTPSP